MPVPYFYKRLFSDNKETLKKQKITIPCLIYWFSFVVRSFTVINVKSFQICIDERQNYFLSGYFYFQMCQSFLQNVLLL